MELSKVPATILKQGRHPKIPIVNTNTIQKLSFRFNRFILSDADAQFNQVDEIKI
jgi:hypothetical protein